MRSVVHLPISKALKKMSSETPELPKDAYDLVTLSEARKLAGLYSGRHLTAQWIKRNMRLGHIRVIRVPSVDVLGRSAIRSLYQIKDPTVLVL